jgi:hypothetical protein
MEMITYLHDPTGRFEPRDDADLGAHLVTPRQHWRLTHIRAVLMPRSTKHKPACSKCGKIIRDVPFWYLWTRSAYCRACGDKLIAPHCLCGCKQAECPVCQATGGRRVSSRKRGAKSPKKPSKKLLASQAVLAPPDLKKRLVELLDRRRAHFEQKRAELIANPLAGALGSTLPDAYPKGVTEKDLRAFRSRTGIELPEDVKQWLKITNGAPQFFGIGEAQKGSNMEELWRLCPRLRDIGWIPVGEDNFGNYFVRVASESGGRSGVFYAEATMPDKLEYAVASDTLHFALFYLRHFEACQSWKMSGWPEDKSFVLSQDPELARVEGAPFYWDAHDFR